MWLEFGHICLMHQIWTLLWYDASPKTKTKTTVHMGVWVKKLEFIRVSSSKPGAPNLDDSFLFVCRLWCFAQDYNQD
jgi:hypothetical protein